MPSLAGQSVSRFVDSYRRFRSERRRKVALSAGSCVRFRSEYETFVRQREHAVRLLLQASDSLLSPFNDPIRSDLLTAVLALQREEIYTAALEWLLRRLPSRTVAAVLGLKARCDQNAWEIDCERTVRVGDQRGRLDMVIACEGEARAIVEVKTREYTAEDLEKHELYRAAVIQIPDLSRAEPVFLAVADEGIDLRGFRFISWRDVCLNVRLNAREVIGSRPFPETALFLAVLGAIEQNLLQLQPDSPRDAPRLAAYLREYLERSDVKSNG